MGSFQELDIVVDCADYRPTVLSILVAIKPQWTEEDICITVRSDSSGLSFSFLTDLFLIYMILL